MVRYSFLVGLFHPRLHAGLSRRLRSITVAPQKGSFHDSARFVVSLLCSDADLGPITTFRNLWSSTVAQPSGCGPLKISNTLQTITALRSL